MIHEGGYVNHPNDPGGETKWGVTKRVARKYGYKGSMRKLPKATANKIAEQLYWDKVRGGELDKAIAWQVLDASYNHGVKHSVKFLQRAVDVHDDGIIGDVTLKAVQARDKNDVILCFNAERLEFVVLQVTCVLQVKIINQIKSIYVQLSTYNQLFTINNFRLCLSVYGRGQGD